MAVERSEGPLVAMIQTHARFVLVPVNPVVLHRFRQAFTPGGAKNDPGDATLLGEIFLAHPEKFSPLVTPESRLAALSRLIRMRRHWVDSRTRLLETLISVLKQYYPQALALAGCNLATPVALAYLQRWPDLTAARKARWQTLERFYRQHHSGRDTLIQERRQLLQSARPVTEDPAVLHPYRLHLLVLVRQLCALNATIAEFDGAIAQLYATAPGRAVIDSLPGAGEALAPRLWVACSAAGAAPSAEVLQRLSGIAPVQRQSGHSKLVSFRWARPRFLHQTWTEFAYHSIARCPWAQAYYQAREKKGHGKGMILRALAFKWIRIVARLWQCASPR